MTTLRNKSKLNADSRDNQKGCRRPGNFRYNVVARMHEEYVTRISGDREGEVTEIFPKIQQD